MRVLLIFEMLRGENRVKNNKLIGRGGARTELYINSIFKLKMNLLISKEIAVWQV